MASKGLTPDQIRRAHDLVARIQGISSSQISTDGVGEISEVHVVATTTKSPKLIARDVESCLKAELGIDVDYKKIGVVLVDDPPVPAVPTVAPAAGPQAPSPLSFPATEVEEFPIEEHPSRFAFQSVNLFLSKDGTRAEVELSRDSVDAFGGSNSENTTVSPAVVIAEATLRAISEFLDGSTRLCLGEVLTIELGDKDAVVVRVDLIGSRGAKSLAGCSIVSGNENQAVVFATLDAVNRVIGKLEFRSSIEYKIR